METNKETTTVEVEKEVTGKTVPSFTLPTPKWAVYVFLITFAATSAALFIIAGVTNISDATKFNWALYLKGFDLFVGILAKGVGIKRTDFID